VYLKYGKRFNAYQEGTGCPQQGNCGNRAGIRKGIKIYEDNTPSNTNTQNKPNAY
jgi:hypothetical protein